MRESTWTEDVQELVQMLVDVLEQQFGAGVVTRIDVDEKRIDITLAGQVSRVTYRRGGQS